MISWSGVSLPSGKHTKSYWTWPFIVDFPINKWWFSIVMLVVKLQLCQFLFFALCASSCHQDFFRYLWSKVVPRSHFKKHINPINCGYFYDFLHLSIAYTPAWHNLANYVSSPRTWLPAVFFQENHLPGHQFRRRQLLPNYSAKSRRR